ncbi:glycosyltransferase [Intrasporangium chromatireducens]|nr:glycosyltransferase [Intrasporangium chromatireducens]
MTSVAIAACNEEAVIARCLGALTADARPGELEIAVAANGCTDGTAQIAQTFPFVKVVELATAGKAHALNAADQILTSFPRVYLDADIELSTAQVRRLCEVLSHAGTGSGALVAVPGRVVNVKGRPLLVRAYYAINRHHPAFEQALFGRGVIVLSEAARRRFTDFPHVIADDLFLDSLFGATERARVESVAVSIESPRRTSDLVRRLVRVRRGNAELRRAPDSVSTCAVRPMRATDWMTRVVARRPALIPAGAVYLILTLFAEGVARFGRHLSWGQDLSTRVQASKGSLPASRAEENV